MALVKFFCCSLTLNNKWQESLACKVVQFSWWGQFSPLDQSCRVGRVTNVLLYFIGSFSCKFVIRTLPSSTISFCNTFDFIINFFIAWNHMQVTIYISNMIPLFLRMLPKRATGIRKGVTSTRNDKIKKMGAKHRRGNEGTVRIWLKLCFVSIFHFSRFPFLVFVTSSFLSVEYLKYYASWGLYCSQSAYNSLVILLWYNKSKLKGLLCNDSVFNPVSAYI